MIESRPDAGIQRRSVRYRCLLAFAGERLRRVALDRGPSASGMMWWVVGLLRTVRASTVAMWLSRRSFAQLVARGSDAALGLGSERSASSGGTAISRQCSARRLRVRILTALASRSKSALWGARISETRAPVWGRASAKVWSRGSGPHAAASRNWIALRQRAANARKPFPRHRVRPAGRG